MLKAAKATCDFYIDNTPVDGVPYWDTGAPGLGKLGDYLNRPADPFNDHEPVDSSAAAIAAQGLLRLGHYLHQKGEATANRYLQAGLTILHTIFDEPYLVLLPVTRACYCILFIIVLMDGTMFPRKQNSLWRIKHVGDYHAREAALYLQRIINNETYYTFSISNETKRTY